MPQGTGEFEWLKSSDILSKFRKQPLRPLPFEALPQPRRPAATKRLGRVFGAGLAAGFALEAVMIKGGYYDALIKAEAKRQQKKRDEMEQSPTAPP
ncbi:hypothetical protein HDV03_005533 [Kappamyces sp. JEL0829]|nr:hypothetical protein HDV03_005533 [Kappamyces sp. JEL0829]